MTVQAAENDKVRTLRRCGMPVHYIFWTVSSLFSLIVTKGQTDLTQFVQLCQLFLWLWRRTSRRQGRTVSRRHTAVGSRRTEFVLLLATDPRFRTSWLPKRPLVVDSTAEHIDRRAWFEICKNRNTTEKSINYLLKKLSLSLSFWSVSSQLSMLTWFKLNQKLLFLTRLGIWW